MIIYPDIELQDGKCVHLWRGSSEDPVVHDEEPITMAKRFVAEGAKRLNLIDLDMVFKAGDNSEIVRDIIKTAGCSVQIGGGISTMEQVRDWVDAGAARVVIATAAVMNPEFVKEAAFAYPDQVVVSIDVYDGKVSVDGWRTATVFTPVEFASQFNDVPLAGIILTDIDRDIDEPQSSIHYVTELASQIRIPVIASGVAKTLDDVSTLKYLPNIAGVIVGRALADKTFTLEEALKIADEPTPPAAKFI